MKELVKIFNKVGGKEILKQYWRGHVLLFAMVETLILGFSRKSLEIVRLAVYNKTLGKLRKEYKCFIKEYKENENLNLEHKTSKKVWICWLQGIDNAPELVKNCYQSVQANMKNRDVVLLTEKNYRDYVQFPDYIQSKIDCGKIKGAHMTDLLRLELLIRYGGTWLDATVYCSDEQYPEYMVDSELFLFQVLKPGLDGHCTCISNWMITAATNNKMLLLTQALLYDYWAKHDNLIDYFIFHDFFQLAIETYPEEWKKVVPCSSSIPHVLLLRLFEEYDAGIWDAVRKMSSFHKLSYKFSENEFKKSGTYYDVIIKNMTGERVEADN